MHTKLRVVSCVSLIEVISVLGEGGFGRVVQALHKPTGRMQAVKVMSKLSILADKQKVLVRGWANTRRWEGTLQRFSRYWADCVKVTLSGS